MNYTENRRFDSDGVWIYDGQELIGLSPTVCKKYLSYIDIYAPSSVEEIATLNKDIEKELLLVHPHTLAWRIPKWQRGVWHYTQSTWKWAKVVTKVASFLKGCWR